MSEGTVNPSREINAGELSGKISRAGHVILRYEIIYPRIHSKALVEQRISRYHLAQARSFERLIKNQYLPAAREQFKALSAYGGFEPVEISASFQVMHNSEHMLSFFTDTYFQLRHRGTQTVRSAKTYDMARGQAVMLPQLFRRGFLFRQQLYQSLYAQIEAEAESNPGSYFADWPQIYRGAVEDKGFYLTDDGIVIYFQQNTIAGHNAGIPSFLVPFSAFPDAMRHLTR